VAGAGWKRLAAIAVLGIGLAAGWWTWTRNVTIDVHLLLTHVEAQVGAGASVTLDNSRLTRFTLRVRGDGGDLREEHAFDYAVGQAAEVVGLSLRVPSDGGALEVECLFALTAGSAPIRTRGTLDLVQIRKLALAQRDSVVVDAGTCGQVDR
jgi:hypothetical protein